MNGFVDFLELDGVGLDLGGADPDRIFAGEHARGLQAIDADIHERAAAGERAIQTPLLGIADGKAEVGVDDLHVTQHFFARQPDALEMVGVELRAVTHAQHLAGLLAGIEHALRALYGNLQRLLAEHVFAGGGGGERVFHVQRVRRHHVNDVDVRVRRHLRHVLVVVDRLV